MEAEENPRTYRISDLFANGAALLDAEDSEPRLKRLALSAAELPEGAEVGSLVVRYASGRMVLADAVPVGRVLPGVVVVAEQPMPTLLGQITQAAVDTIARQFKLERNVAAHLMVVWLRMEYRV